MRFSLFLALAWVAMAATAAAQPKPSSPAKPAARPSSGPSLPFALPGAPRPPGAARPAPPAPAAEPATLAALLAAYPADSLVPPLRRFEAAHGRTREGAEAAFLLGQLHFARGEYKQANEAYARAAARFSPDRKPEARYWQGVAALGQGDPVQARAALEEVAQPGSPRRVEARFALSEAWIKAGRPERAIEELKLLLADAPGEMEAPALARLATLATRIGDEAEAKRANEQLRRLRPEATAVLPRPPGATPGTPAPPAARLGRSEGGRIAVQIGAFSDPARARGLLEQARSGGWEKAQISTQGQGGATLHVVRIGWFANETDARAAGERASRDLGVAYRLIRP